MTTTTTNPSYELATKIIGIRGEIHSTKVLLHNASEMRDARGVGRLQAELDRKIRVRDAWVRKLFALQGENIDEYILAIEEGM